VTFIGWAALATAIASPWPAGVSLKWRIDARVHEGNPAAADRAGAALAGFEVVMNCVAEPAERRHQAARCTLPEPARLGARDEDGLTWTTLEVADDVWFEVRWRSDGKLVRVQPRGPEPAGLGDWVGLALGAVELRAPPDGWDGVTTWAASDPAVLRLTGSISPMASHLDWQVAAHGSEVVLDGTGGGAMDPTWLAELLGQIADPLAAHATDAVRLDATGVVVERLTTLWLRPLSGHGNVGSQQVRVARLP
jgi:hypothetical protein